MKSLTLAASVALAAALAQQASAAVLYDNGGAGIADQSVLINYGSQVADSFTLTHRPRW